MNQILQAGNEVFFHDALGNIQRRVTPDREVTYLWGVENRLESVVIRDRQGVFLKSISFSYNAFGERVERILNDGENIFVEEYVKDESFIYEPLAIHSGAGIVKSFNESGVIEDNGEVKYTLSGIGGIARLIDETGNIDLKLEYDLIW